LQFELAIEKSEICNLQSKNQQLAIENLKSAIGNRKSVGGTDG